jgi:hypothetical protein
VFALIQWSGVGGMASLQSTQIVCTIGSFRFTSYVSAHFGGRICSRTFFKTATFSELRVVVGRMSTPDASNESTETPQKLPPAPPKFTNQNQSRQHDSKCGGWTKWDDCWNWKATAGTRW